VVTSRISRSAGAQSFGGAHRGRVCVYVFIRVSVLECCEHVLCNLKKTCTHPSKKRYVYMVLLVFSFSFSFSIILFLFLFYV
jgi:hypothetical protein